MRDERKSRNVQRRACRTCIVRRWEAVYFAAVSLLMVMNTICIFRVQAQVKGINDTWSKVLEGLNVSVSCLGEDAGAGAESGVDAWPGQEGASSGGAGDSPQYAAKHGASGGRILTLEDTDYVSLCGLPEVDRPVKRTEAEVLDKLRGLAKDSEMIADIYKHNSDYPDRLLEALANNPEMADFVAGYLSSKPEASGKGLTDAEKEQDFPLFLQWDPRWGYAEYGDSSNIGLAGCGPTCLSMGLYYLLGDEELTPDKIAAYSMEKGYYMSGTGTAWALLSDVPALYGVKVSQPKATDWRLKKELDMGKVVICSMGAGDFTAAGHFVVIYGYDEEGFLVNDPNCVARSRKQWTFEEIGGQIKHTWVLGL